MKTTKIRVRLHHTDAAGVIFFPNLFYLCQEVLEDVFADIGMPIPSVIDSKDKTTPLSYVVHCSADFTGHIV